MALLLGVQEICPRAGCRQVQQLAQFADIKDFYKKQLFLPFLTTDKASLQGYLAIAK